MGYVLIGTGAVILAVSMVLTIVMSVTGKKSKSILEMKLKEKY